MKRLLCAGFIALIAQSTLSTPVLAEPMPDRCIPAVSTAILRYGIAYGRIIQEGQAQSDITTAYEAAQLAIVLDCDRQAMIRGMDCIIGKVKETGKKPEIAAAISCAQED
jgi:hypothetical protein